MENCCSESAIGERSDTENDGEWICEMPGETQGVPEAGSPRYRGRISNDIQSNDESFRIC
jgi:hypothetical protein